MEDSREYPVTDLKGRSGTLWFAALATDGEYLPQECLREADIWLLALNEERMCMTGLLPRIALP